MSKTSVALSLKDMYACKHALQATVRTKKEKVECEAKNSEYVEMLVKDISREEALIEKFNEEIEDFKNNNQINSGR